MNHLGWTLRNVSEEERPGIIAAIPAMACEAFSLCATVGCLCGEGGEALCHESDAGSSSPVHVSEGPNWSITVHGVGQSVLIDVYFDLPVLGRESSAFRRALIALGKPMHIRTGGNA